MSNTRAEIEAEIIKLQAELAAAQPDELTLKSPGGTTFHFERNGSIDVRRTLSGQLLRSTYLDDSSMAELRDYLNYHFPKTTEETA